jgi:hypothetical protein
MKKLIAIVNVVAWSGFWAFGYIALTSGPASQGQMIVAALIAFAALVTGVAAWIWVARHAEATGYARRSGQLPPEIREKAQAEWGKTDALP